MVARMTQRPPVKMSRQTQVDLGLSDQHMAKSFRLDDRSEWFYPKMFDPRDALPRLRERASFPKDWMGPTEKSYRVRRPNWMSRLFGITG